MKKIIVLALLLYFATATFSQQPVQKPYLAGKDYNKIIKQQKSAAWILTSVGAAGLIVTLAIDAGQATANSLTTLFSLGTVEPEYKSYTAPYLLSTAVVVGGTYLFLASSKNRKRAKAASVFINMEKTPVLRHTIIRNQSFPVAGLRIGL